MYTSNSADVPEVRPPDYTRFLRLKRGRLGNLFLESRQPSNDTERRLSMLRAAYLEELPGRHSPIVMELAERTAAAQIEAEVAEAICGPRHPITRERSRVFGRLYGTMHEAHTHPNPVEDGETGED
ncbi:hypothetical protein [Xanthobacter autotrophicus]|uniref:hypothetical protein n=1 Tax=Xanthobacter autotrophicus TaxID=280 RepID=UPI0024A647BE|nr:hypothetical protein [Xanthobacter autotrophicus]MDI4656571.1 hypothetical protein [Xanthobacter autotrophicus]